MEIISLLHFLFVILLLITFAFAADDLSSKESHILITDWKPSVRRIKLPIRKPSTSLKPKRCSLTASNQDKLVTCKFLGCSNLKKCLNATIGYASNFPKTVPIPSQIGLLTGLTSLYAFPLIGN
jgi:hypothetical protein